MNQNFTIRQTGNCFEIRTEEGVAYLEYSLSEDTIDLTHTFVPPAMEGRGLAGALTKAAFDYARDNNLHVKTTCPYTAIWQKRHPGYN